MQEAKCNKTLMDFKFSAETKVADSERAYKMRQAAYQKEVNAAVSCCSYLFSFIPVHFLYPRCPEGADSTPQRCSTRHFANSFYL